MARLSAGFTFVLLLIALAGPASGGDCEGCRLSPFGWSCSDVCQNHSGDDDCDIVWSGQYQRCELNGSGCTGTASCPNSNCRLVEMCGPENQGAFLVVPNGEITSLAWTSPEASPSSEPLCEA